MMKLKGGKLTKYFIALNTHQKIGSQTILKLLDFFGDLEKIWQLGQIDFARIGLKEEQISAIKEVKEKVDPDDEMEKLKKSKIEVLTIKDKNYPGLLRELADPPAILYYKGKLPKKNDFLVSIVGSRACTSYGRQVAEELAYNLAKEGITIVSGLALGIDSIAHKAALQAKGKTIAVLGCGLDIIYPYTHKRLAEEIIKKDGAIISEFSLGTPPLKPNFPMRNRIISGISKATIVVEAALKSGALITAKSALEQNREVFAVPGSIFNPNSEGCNNLIKMGAYPVTSYEDILSELGIKSKIAKIKKEAEGDSKEEKVILSLLSYEPVSIDKLKELSKLDIAVLNSTLIMLEIKGLVKNIGGAQYIRIKN
jgi:DNA processing protein